MFACPLCGSTFVASDYLRTVFVDTWSEWAANLVTHYRHAHTDYDAVCQSGFESDAEHAAFKRRVNNGAKREILRGILSSKLDQAEQRRLIAGFAALEHNDEVTVHAITRGLQVQR